MDGQSHSMDQSVAIGIVLVAGAGLILCSLLFIRHYTARQQSLAAGTLPPPALSGLSTLSGPYVARGPGRYTFYTPRELEGLGLTPSNLPGRSMSRPSGSRGFREVGLGGSGVRAGAGVNRQQEGTNEETGEELPTYVAAAKLPPALEVVEWLEYPGAAYIPSRSAGGGAGSAGAGLGIGRGEPPPYERGGVGEGTSSSGRRI